ncbi:MAG: uncharacterized protein JWR80_517 [Bradyrhizobium sp.]|nr:uncharacterized protein [Bradyrhizobium sp.]
MNASRSDLQRDDVLDAFGMEASHGRDTLDRYLREFPQYAGELIDLSREMMRRVVPDAAPLSAAEQSRVDTAWSRHVAAQPHAATDPFAALSLAQSRGVATSLDVPRQVITAFRERKVLLDSVPRLFLRRFAEAAKVPFAAFAAGLSAPPTMEPARSFKASAKPGTVGQVTFERILIDAGVPEARRAELLADEA